MTDMLNHWTIYDTPIYVGIGTLWGYKKVM